MTNPIREEWTSADGQHRILWGDCLEILPTLDTSEVAAVLADPPYGIGRDGKPPSTSSHGGHKGYEFLGWDAKRPTKQTFDLIRQASRHQIIWGGNYFADVLPAARGWLFWDKGQEIDQADGELAWTSLDMPLRRKTMNRCILAKDKAVHPTQKPVALMIWCLSFLPPGLILDPFAGSCTVAVACARTGRRSISIEIKERYFRIGIERMEREAKRHPLLEPARPKQLELIS